MTDPSTITVPLSTILDALEGALTEEEQAALSQQLGLLNPAGVAPGDLITADLFNQMRRDIDDLQVRVSQLEGAAGGPIIDSLSPSSTVAVNATLVVTGRNFNPIRNFNTVLIGDVEITQFRSDSSPTHLIFPVPDLFTGLPANLPVRVTTEGRTSNALSITVSQPDQVQGGQYTFGAGQVPGGVIAVGADVPITWSVQALTLFPDNVTLSLVIGGINGASAAAWQADVVFDPPSPMPILPGQTKQVQATVTVPAGAVSANISLQLASQDGNVVNLSDAVTITVGEEVEVSDPRIDLTFSIPVFGGGQMTTGPVTIDGATSDGILVKKGQNGKLKFHALDTRTSGPGATFAITAEVLAPANGLTVGTGPNPNASGAGAVDPGEDLPFDLPLSAPSGATTDATARLKVTCEQTRTASGLAPYTSFKIIPLKIVA
jgi:hypothetical protein